MRILIMAMALAVSGTVWADTLTLKSGRVVNGDYLGGTPRQVRMQVGERVDTFDLTDVAKIEFGSAATSASTDSAVNSADSRPRLKRSTTILRPDAAAAAAAPARTPVELPAGANIVIRMIDAVDSEVSRVGQTFKASLDEPIVLDGNTVVDRGADVIVKLVDQKDSGKLTGTTQLTLDLVSMRVGDRMVDINTQTVSQSSASRGARTAKVAGGTAALGAIIGAIAGGGKGAAIGAGAGAAAGAGAEIVTKGQRVRIPSETRLTFLTDTPIKL
jgi:hypothetical protein